jgi:hypothetical protein
MFKKILFAVLGVLIVVIGFGYSYLVLRKPEMAQPADIKIEATPARLARGKHLFDMSSCKDCHSQRDMTKFAGPVVPGTEGGGFEFPEELGFPGKVRSANITPDPETGIGTWTDGEKIRAIREGISKDGNALFPLMPYTHFRNMSDEDVYSIVAYLNTLPPIKKISPRTELKFPVKYLIKSAPKPVQGRVPEPDRSNPVKYGEYVFTISACSECHTQAEKGQMKMDLFLAGGREFRVGPYLVSSANITSDPETGIGKWSEERFVSKFTNFRSLSEGNPPASTQANFTLMPWTDFAHMPEEDLKAIYAYLRTVKPVENKVDIHPPVVLPRVD